MKNNNKHITNTYYEDNIKVTIYEYIEPSLKQRLYR